MVAVVVVGHLVQAKTGGFDRSGFLFVSFACTPPLPSNSLSVRYVLHFCCSISYCVSCGNSRLLCPAVIPRDARWFWRLLVGTVDCYI
jgi:hypothetical protein